MGKSKAPKYATTTYDTGGLFGKSTNDASGTKFTPTGWETKTMQTIGSAVPSTLNSMVNNDFMNDANFLRYQDQFNRNMSQAYDTSVLSALANRGLMRSSGLQAATNAFGDTLANNQLNLYDNYYNRLNNNLSALMNTSNNLYNYITGINQGALSNSNAVNQHNMQAAQMNNRNALWGQLANAAGTIAGAAVGGPAEASVGRRLGSLAGSAASGNNNALMSSLIDATGI